LRLLLLLIAAAAGIVDVHAQTSSARDEYRLKAAFVAHVPQFVEWPAGVLEGSDAFRLCVVEPDPFGDALRALTAGDTVKGRPFAVRQLARDQPLTGCHLLFVPARVDARPLVARAASLPILTVGEGTAFLDADGAIALRLVDRRVRFDVNVAAVNRARLKVSSQLLALAVTVRGGPQ
jgi:hypothetical protein